MERYSVFWYRKPDEVSPHPGVSPYMHTRVYTNLPQHNGGQVGLDLAAYKAWDMIALVQFIPVVTFLAPLASNSEGLKDR